MDPNQLLRQNQAPRDDASHGAALAAPAGFDYLLVVGPGRSGTDYLFDHLRRHP